MEHLAGVVRSLREDAAMTQEELAEKAGLSVRTVSDIERGLRKRLYKDTAGHLAAAFDLDGEARGEFVELARGRASAIRRELDADFRRRFVAWHVDRVSALAAHVGHEEQWYAVLEPMNRTSAWRCGGQPTLTTPSRSSSSVRGCGGTGRLAGTWRSVVSGSSAA